MATLNRPARELTCKVIYYGPDGAGKRTSLTALDAALAEVEGRGVTLVGDGAPGFGHVPLHLGRIGGLAVRLHLFSVPECYATSVHPTYVDLLRALDAVVLVADSRAPRAGANLRALKALEDDLRGLGRDLRELPLVLQWNRQDEPDALGPALLQDLLDPGAERPGVASVALRGEGLLAALARAAVLAVRDLDRRYGVVEPRAAATSTCPLPERDPAAALLHVDRALSELCGRLEAP